MTSTVNIDANAVITALRSQLADAQFALAVATARAEQAETALAARDTNPVPTEIAPGEDEPPR